MMKLYIVLSVAYPVYMFSMMNDCFHRNSTVKNWHLSADLELNTIQYDILVEISLQPSAADKRAHKPPDYGGV